MTDQSKPVLVKSALARLDGLTTPSMHIREKSYTVVSPEAASIIFRAMEVEKELRENLVSRDMTLDGSTIRASFRAVDEHSLNSSLFAFEKSFEFAKEIYEELA